MGRPYNKVVISGGGTGGHVFPAIAIANAIKAKQPQAEILFVGALGRIEMEKVPAAGYPIEGLNISGLQRRLTVKNLSFPIKLIGSLLKARKIVRHFRPDVAVGVGGYASGPLGYAAAKRNVPLLLQEQNSYPGITNKLLAKKAKTICVAYSGLERFFPESKLVFTGNPVRKDLTELTGDKQEALQSFGLKPHLKTILVLGGSGGARSINQAIAANIDAIAASGTQWIWQTGKFYFGDAQKALEQYKADNIKALAFITAMDRAYIAADIIVTRAGAGTISELCLVGKPAILVPSPNVTEDHQTKNAMSLVDKHAALLVKDVDAKAELVKTAVSLAKDDERATGLAIKIKELAIADSAERIADEVLKLANK